MKDQAIQIILVMLEFLSHCFGFGLVPVEEAEALASTPIPYELQ